MQSDPQLTRSELALAEKVGLFLLPTIREIVAAMATKPRNATATFCRDFAAAQSAREALPVGAPPMARVELETRMLDLASKFVASHKE